MINSVKTGIVLSVVCLVILFPNVRAFPSDDDLEDGPYGSGSDFQTREFMIPHPRLGRYMDYGVLKLLANYLKDSYTLNEIIPNLGSPQQPPMLQRELRDMKGKGYGIPIPRVGRRSVPENAEPAPSQAQTASGAGIRTILAEYFRNLESQSKRQQSASSRSSMFTPRVGRAKSPTTSKYSNWAPIPRVGKRK